MGVMEQDHYANLAEVLEDDDLADISNTVIEGYETDKESREEWEQIFEHVFDRDWETSARSSSSSTSARLA